MRFCSRLEFDGKRGIEALKSTIRTASLPATKPGQNVKYLIIAKSVLATGCTAV